MNFASPIEKEKAKHTIKDKCLLVAKKKVCTTNVKQENDEHFPSLPVKEEQGLPAKRPKIDEEFDGWLNDVIFVGETSSFASSDENKVDTEMEKYDIEPLHCGDPLEWWKSRQSSLPVLSEVARSVLAVPATSVPSERIFSKAGQIVSKRRASLKPNHVDMMIFLNKNYDFIN